MRKWERVMSAKNFREYADECLGWAKTAKSDKERRSYLQMAETWLKAAAQYEALDRPPPPHDTPPLSPSSEAHVFSAP
jgi:hypothetical protein